MSFEKGLERLNQITSELEKGDLPLEKAVELYLEGMKISAQCKSELDRAKLIINEYNDNSKEMDVL